MSKHYGSIPFQKNATDMELMAVFLDKLIYMGRKYAVEEVTGCYHVYLLVD